MSSVNKVILLGRIGQDPDVKYTASGDAVVNLSLATSESWKDKKSGQKKKKRNGIAYLYLVNQRKLPHNIFVKAAKFM